MPPNFEAQSAYAFFIYHDMIFVIASWSAPIESLYSRQFGRWSLWQKIRNDATNIIIICK